MLKWWIWIAPEWLTKLQQSNLFVCCFFTLGLTEEKKKKKKPVLTKYLGRGRGLEVFPPPSKLNPGIFKMMGEIKNKF